MAARRAGDLGTWKEERGPLRRSPSSWPHVGERIVPSRSFHARCLRLFLIRSASLRWLMKTVEYDSYAALTASYFASLPRKRPSPLVSTMRAFIWRYRILGVIISWICQTRNIVRLANVWWKFRIEKYVNAIFSLYFIIILYIFL